MIQELLLAIDKAITINISYRPRFVIKIDPINAVADSVVRLDPQPLPILFADSQFLAHPDVLTGL